MLPSVFLCQRLGLSKERLELYASTCPRRYKKYRIPKRNGGFRNIAQPSKDLKVVQRILLNELLIKQMPIHKSATAYQAKHSILDNAKPHLKNKYLLKMDFRNFFPSITASGFSKYLIHHNIIPKTEVGELELLSRIFFMWEQADLVLSIGAPSSPAISNAIMYSVDMQLSEMADTRNIAYTRYSDDLTFSTNVKDSLFVIPDLVAEILEKQSFLKIAINEDKTLFSSTKHNRHVTGVTITNNGTASLGRKRKREIKSRVFLTKHHELSEKERNKLKGLIAFANVVEPEFLEMLKRKYPDQMRELTSL